MYSGPSHRRSSVKNQTARNHCVVDGIQSLNSNATPKEVTPSATELPEHLGIFRFYKYLIPILGRSQTPD